MSVWLPSPQAVIEVFIENEAGKAIKNHFDEKELRRTGSSPLSRPYPFPYGFVIGTTAEDGDCVDCFVITGEALVSGQRVRCTPIGLMEQREDGVLDHNILAVLDGESSTITNSVSERLREFVLHVFDHVPGKNISVGRLYDAAEAYSYLAACLRDIEPQ